MTTHPVIENFSIVASLGLCFHDTATGERIFSGLNVSIYPATATVRKTKTALNPNRSGVFVLQKIKRLEGFSRGKGDADFWSANPPVKLFVVEVFDFEGKFQPVEFTLELPVKGIYEWENIPNISPNGNLKSIPLYSAPTRKNSDGMAIIRAHLKNINGVPASFAVLEARFENSLVARGIADRDGQIALMFPALAPQSNPIVSPPATSTHISLAEQFWNLDLTVKYQPDIFQISPPDISIENGEENLPDLRLVLAQAAGTLWTDNGQTAEFTTAVLQTGKELVLRSHENANTSSPPVSETVFSSFLYVSPAI